MFGPNYWVTILLSLPGIIIGLAFHEFAHAFASDRLGDPTPRLMGRLTLSPVPHIDPIGLLMIIFAGFGWARPVQINPRYYKNIRRDDTIVSLAGPLMNLALAIIFAALLKIFFISSLDNYLSVNMWSNVSEMLVKAIDINIMLFVFNLIPIPPLDGFHILRNFISIRNYNLINTLERYGSIVLIIFIISPLSTILLNFLISPIASFIIILFGL